MVLHHGNSHFSRCVFIHCQLRGLGINKYYVLCGPTETDSSTVERPLKIEQCFQYTAQSA